jgi:enterochelin esterase-like enzyme
MNQHDRLPRHCRCLCAALLLLAACEGSPQTRAAGPSDSDDAAARPDAPDLPREDVSQEVDLSDDFSPDLPADAPPDAPEPDLPAPTDADEDEGEDARDLAQEDAAAPDLGVGDGGDVEEEEEDAAPAEAPWAGEVMAGGARWPLRWDEGAGALVGEVGPQGLGLQALSVTLWAPEGGARVSWGVASEDAGRLGPGERALSEGGAPARWVSVGAALRVSVAPGGARPRVVLEHVGVEVRAPELARRDAAPWSREGRGALLWALGALDEAPGDEARRALWGERRGALGAAGALPLLVGEEVLWVFYDVVPPSPEQSGPYQVGASWNGWEPAAVPLARVEGTRLHLGVSSVARVSRGQYKLVHVPSQSWFQDPGNDQVWWDGFDAQGVGSFNSALVREASATQGRLVWWPGVESAALGNRRDVYVYLPPGYEAEGASFPAIYFHDGNEALTRADFAGALDAWSQQAPSRRAVGVFVHLAAQEERLAEYTFGPGSRGDAYGRFLVEALVPGVEASFKVRAAPEARALFGMSLGGLISYYVALEHDDFGRVGGMSSSFFWEEGALIERYEAEARRPLVACYLDSGSPRDNFEVTAQLAAVLRAKGYPLVYQVEEGAGHEWSAWRRRLPAALEALLP